jgi:acyl-CoA thioester hydrolase
MALDFSDSKFLHKTGIQIRFNDIDVLQHVNNTVYQSYFDTARFSYFKNVLDIDKFTNEQWVVIANIEIDFAEPVLIGDFIEVQTKVPEIRSKSLVMLQQVAAITSCGHTIKTRSRSVLVGYNLETGRSAAIPDIWRGKIAAFEKDLHTSCFYSNKL